MIRGGGGSRGRGGRGGKEDRTQTKIDEKLQRRVSFADQKEIEELKNSVTTDLKKNGKIM